ncbi:MAG: hypothetical protein QNJ88_01410 [Acidimicrobiia bacterium]|nr:hypothetical protein [Acidimicrobiia bacterium]
MIRWIHLLAAAVWTGGLITLGALVVAVRRSGGDRGVLQAMARQFGRVSWAAMAISVLTGVLQVERLGFDWADGALSLKLTLVVLAAGLAYAHQLTAKRTSPAVRGIIQAVILLLSIGIFGAAVNL